MQQIAQQGTYPSKLRLWARHHGFGRALLAKVSGVSTATVSRAYNSRCAWESANELSRATYELRREDPLTALQILGCQDWRAPAGIAPAK